ncbi:MAG: hypothetical protein QOE91_1445 [Gaiellaceae bacterium]|nr:hypothetical protein [Gaiellaceae bacterium]
MSQESPWNEERLAELLGSMKPVPAGWVEAAAQLPRLRAVLDDLVARAEADSEFRAALVADLEATLAREGVEPSPRVLDELRRRIA